MEDGAVVIGATRLVGRWSVPVKKKTHVGRTNAGRAHGLPG